MIKNIPIVEKREGNLTFVCIPEEWTDTQILRWARLRSFGDYTIRMDFAKIPCPFDAGYVHAVLEDVP